MLNAFVTTLLKCVSTLGYALMKWVPGVSLNQKLQAFGGLFADFLTVIL
jgi:hypothetical protein